jgi:magnesium-transporting ATPase (P-type)
MVPFSFNLLGILMSCVAILIPSHATIKQYLTGVINWLVYGIFIWLSISNIKNSERFDVNDGSNSLAMLVLSLDFLSCSPITPEYSMNWNIQKEMQYVAWYLLSLIALSIVILTRCENCSFAGALLDQNEGTKWVVVILIVSSMLRNQCTVISNPICELFKIKNYTAKYKKDSLFFNNIIVYLLTCCCVIGGNAANYTQVQNGLLVIHFILHWLSHISCALDMFLTKNQQKNPISTNVLNKDTKKSIFPQISKQPNMHA